MYEYECLFCGEKFYSSSEYSSLTEKTKICERCNGPVFYSLEELTKHRDDKYWLKGLEKEYTQLEELIRKLSDNK